MAALETALDDALSGQGRLVMLAGEPGIGKTRTAQELAAYAKEHGAQVLWGWCYEEGSLSLPYLPFVEALRAYVLSREPEDLRHDLGSGHPTWPALSPRSEINWRSSFGRRETRMRIAIGCSRP